MRRKTSHLVLNPIICLLVLVHATQSLGKDFGKVASTFEIKEEGFVTMMHRKLETIDLNKENEKMAAIAKERVENPKPVPFIKKAEETRTFYFDATYTLLEDILLPNGQVLHKAGIQVNPLDHMKLNRRMFFIDGRDKSQLEWLKMSLKQYAPNQSEGYKIADEVIENRIILTAGRIFDIQKELGEGETVYFDQAGELTTKFGIKAVPAIAIEEDKKIKITEFNIDKNIED